MAIKIALVDDDQNILASVSLALEAEGYQIDTYFDSEQALIGLIQRPPDLAILDIKMPRMDGTELLGKLRQKSGLPVIFLTSKDDELDEALGLGMGADDYITKPFSQRLLLARIKAVLRRSGSEASSGSKEDMISHGDLLLDSDRHLCSWKGVEVKLTVTVSPMVALLESTPLLELIDTGLRVGAVLSKVTLEASVTVETALPALPVRSA